jgi:hypothetical protein
MRMQAIETRPESAATYMSMQKDDWLAINSMETPAVRKFKSLNSRSAR